jgi:hypothetical protein
MIDILFDNRFGEKKSIGKADKIEDAWSIVFQFLKEHNFKSYYQRTTMVSDNTMWIDVGSHSEFFYFVWDNSDEVPTLI